MGPVAGMVVGGIASGLIGGLLGSKGQSKAAKEQNKFYQWLYDPNRIKSAGSTLNPYGSAAMANQKPTNGNQFAMDMWRLAQGQDLYGGSMLDQPLTALERGYDTNLLRLQAMIGRTMMPGGLANAYTLANLAGRTNARGNLHYQYQLWRQQQRRADIQALMGWQNQAQQTAAGLASAQGQTYQQPVPWQTTASNAIQGGLAGWSQMAPYWQQYYSGLGKQPTSGSGTFMPTSAGTAVG